MVSFKIQDKILHPHDYRNMYSKNHGHNLESISMKHHVFQASLASCGTLCTHYISTMTLLNPLRRKLHIISIQKRIPEYQQVSKILRIRHVGKVYKSESSILFHSNVAKLQNRVAKKLDARCGLMCLDALDDSCSL